MYKNYSVKKKRGGFRRITEPLPELKGFLFYLKDLLDHFEVSDAAHGFVQGRSTLTNALPHRCQDYVYNIDLKNFFPSIKREPMLDELKDLLPLDILDWISELCFWKEELPQGAPTSPVLSNIYMLDIDNCFVKKAGEMGLCYTRYADDLTFSGPTSLLGVREKVDELFDFISAQLVKKNLTVNPRKIKLTSRSQCQRVTGIVVNNSKLTLPGRKRESLFLALKGEDFNELSENDKGYLEYVNSIDPVFYKKLRRNMKKNA